MPVAKATRTVVGRASSPSTFPAWSVTDANMETTDLSLVLKATEFAAEMHRHQRRKDEVTPYINHPIEVARMLAEHGADVPTVVAALLHDTIEDTTATYDDVQREFGDVVACLVLEVTDDKSLPKHVRKQLQVERAPQKSRRAKQIKLADKCANLRSLAEKPPLQWDQARTQAYFDWADQVVAGLRGAHAGLEACFDAASIAGRSALGLQPRHHENTSTP